MFINQIFSQRLKIAMENKDITAAELSRQTNINKSSISEYLAGKFVPKQNKTFLIAIALNVSPAWLMGADDPQPETLMLSNEDKTLIINFHKLNATGQEKALDYIHDLTENNKYTEKQSVTSA